MTAGCPCCGRSPTPLHRDNPERARCAPSWVASGCWMITVFWPREDHRPMPKRYPSASGPSGVPTDVVGRPWRVVVVVAVPSRHPQSPPMGWPCGFSGPKSRHRARGLPDLFGDRVPGVSTLPAGEGPLPLQAIAQRHPPLDQRFLAPTRVESIVGHDGGRAFDESGHGQGDRKVNSQLRTKMRPGVVAERSEHAPAQAAPADRASGGPRRRGMIDQVTANLTASQTQLWAAQAALPSRGSA